MEKIGSKVSHDNTVQSPTDEEVRSLTAEAGPGNATPEPRNEKEIEIAASLGPRRKRCSGFSVSDDSGSGCSEDACRSAVEGLNITSPVPARPVPAQLEGDGASSFRLQLGGLVSHPYRPGSGRYSASQSRKDSGCSTPQLGSLSARSEHLEYPCANFVQTPIDSKRSSSVLCCNDCDNDLEKMTIKCHYNPIMDEYLSLTDGGKETNNDLPKSTEEDIRCLFELCKEDDIFSRQPVIDMGKFLQDLERRGIRRTDKRLATFTSHLHQFMKEDQEFLQDTTFSSIESLSLNKGQFARAVEVDFPLISKAFKNQLIIPEFPNFCNILRDIYEDCRKIDSGNVASYIPQLAKYSPDNWAMSICTVDGQRFSLGNVNTMFTMQSCSKPFTYAVCLNELGNEIVHKYVGQEPSGRMFNNLSLDFNNKPHNPLLNSGAIMSASLLLNLVKPEMPMSEKFDLVMEYFGKMAGNEDIGFNNSVFLSERDTADRNFALAYFMKENKCFPRGFNLQETLDFYFQTCSMEVNCESLSVFGASLANGGTCPTTGEEILDPRVVRDVLSLMHSCGMYNYSGQFAFKVGLPAKSGVSGSLVLVVPGVMGIGLWSPALDALGNTVRGVSFAEKFIEKFNFHRFDNMCNEPNKIDPRKHRYDVQKQATVSLLYSATTGDVTALRRFHGQGYNMAMWDYDKRTALHLASAEGHLECVKFLVETCRVSPAVRDRWGFTPLVEAHRFQHKNVVGFLASFMKDKLPKELEYSMQLVEKIKKGERRQSTVSKEISLSKAKEDGKKKDSEKE